MFNTHLSHPSQPEEKFNITAHCVKVNGSSGGVGGLTWNMNTFLSYWIRQNSCFVIRSIFHSELKVKLFCFPAIGFFFYVFP